MSQAKRISATVASRVTKSAVRCNVRVHEAARTFCSNWLISAVTIHENKSIFPYASHIYRHLAIERLVRGNGRIPSARDRPEGLGRSPRGTCVAESLPHYDPKWQPSWSSVCRLEVAYQPGVNTMGESPWFWMLCTAIQYEILSCSILIRNPESSSQSQVQLPRLSLVYGSVPKIQSSRVLSCYWSLM